MAAADWNLRPATEGDRETLFVLHRAAMRDYVDKTWGWDDAEQERMFNDNFSPAAWKIIEVGQKIAGMLAVEETSKEVWLASVESHPRRALAPQSGRRKW
jgi:hypothetical protein